MMSIRLPVSATCLTLIVCSALGFVSASLAQDAPAGSVAFPAYSLPPSQFSSPEMRAAVAKQVAKVDMNAGQPPAADAPMAEWEAFWKFYDENIYYELPRTKELYPSNLEPKVIGGVETIVVTPKSGISPKNRNRVLINLHGGGFFAGWGAGALAPSMPVASYMKAKVITVNYREMPKHRFPAGSEDVAAVYKELLKEYPAQNIGIYGCSAGGMLTAQAVAWFEAHNLPRPGAIGVFCAGGGVGGGGPGDSSVWNARGIAALPAPPAAAVRPNYFTGADLKSPLVSPGSSPKVLAKFPPTLVMTATRDPALSPSVLFHSQLLKAGVESQLYIIEGGWHGSVELAPDPPESRDANAYTAKWFDDHLGTDALKH